MTPDEIISSIKKSSIPTICVEGVQDKSALRLVEKLVGIRGSILICNGRNNLFAVWKRRNEFAGKKVVFLADRDLYVLKRIPSEYDGIIFTHGYSLENDILLSERWKHIFSEEDTQIFELAMNLSLNYYWNQCRTSFSSGAPPVWTSSFKLYEEHRLGNYVIEPGSDQCKLFNKIANKPYQNLRGKNLLDCIHIALSHSGRTTKFNSPHIIEISVKPKEGRHLKSLIKKINIHLC